MVALPNAKEALRLGRNAPSINQLYRALPEEIVDHVHDFARCTCRRAPHHSSSEPIAFPAADTAARTSPDRSSTAGQNNRRLADSRSRTADSRSQTDRNRRRGGTPTGGRRDSGASRSGGRCASRGSSSPFAQRLRPALLLVRLALAVPAPRSPFQRCRDSNSDCCAWSTVEAAVNQFERCASSRRSAAARRPAGPPRSRPSAAGSRS